MVNQLKEQFGHYFLIGQFEDIYGKTAESFQNLVSFEQFRELSLDYNSDVSNYKCIVSNTFQGLEQYIWVDDTYTKAVVVAFDDNNIIQGMYFKPYETYPGSDQIWTKNTYSMPISDKWYVFWGGTNEFINYHYPYEQQRYAYDLVKMSNNETYRNSKLQNESYYAFGAEVVAPADGVVVEVLDGINDNIPGEMDEENLAGNYCIIAHEHNEYSMLAHFKKDSICVETGDKVKAGQLLGLCGNSGNSSEAHIHFQVMDHQDFLQAKSLRIQFHSGAEPIQGDIVKPSSASWDKTDTLDKIENSATAGELMLLLPRVIGQFFK
ncbi:M23 family metallopeptidase [Solibacillus sp. FSL R5-0449]|uniref:M23 family metallopeptidase n=1 Tax=Solibacillus sp. FSL R5-0449 TaxID=2921639 RepID=UPI0030D14656